MNPEDITLREGSQTQKPKHLGSRLCEMLRICKPVERESRRMVTGGWRETGDWVWVFFQDDENVLTLMR